MNNAPTWATGILLVWVSINFLRKLPIIILFIETVNTIVPSWLIFTPKHDRHKKRNWRIFINEDVFFSFFEPIKFFYFCFKGLGFCVKEPFENRTILRLKIFGRHIHMFYFGATGTPVLDFLWHLLWVSKLEWVLPYSNYRGKCNVYPQRFTSSTKCCQPLHSQHCRPFKMKAQHCHLAVHSPNLGLESNPSHMHCSTSH